MASEKAEELERDVASLSVDLAKLQKDGLIKIDHEEIEKSEIEVTGKYDPDSLFTRLDYAIDSAGRSLPLAFTSAELQ